jgi:hypothetical protein
MDNFPNNDKDTPTPFSSLWEPVASTFPVIIDNAHNIQFRPENFFVIVSSNHNKITLDNNDLFEDYMPSDEHSDMPI